MDDLFQTFGDEVAAMLRHPAVALTIQLVVAYLVILWLAASYWTFRDLRHRTRDPFVPYLGAGGVLVMTPFAFPLALLAYRVVRPQETLAEQRTRDLEACVLTAEVATATCATCGQPIDDMWMRCPACGNQLAVSCQACGGRIEPDWSVCAWCARDLEPFGEPAVELPAPLPVPATVLVDEPSPAAEPRDPIPGWRADPEVMPEPIPATPASISGPQRTVWPADRRRTGVPTLVGGGAGTNDGRRRHR